jgi:tRNA (uracil-5-)-methyltransferase
MTRWLVVLSRMGVLIVLARPGRVAFAWSSQKASRFGRRTGGVGRSSSCRSCSTASTAAVLGAEDAPDQPSSSFCITADPPEEVKVQTWQQQLPPRKFVEYPFAYHQELILEIESITNRGWGVGRVVLPASTPSGQPSSLVDSDPDSEDPRNIVQADRKWVVMVVPGVIPGEVVKVRIFRNFNSYSEADVVEVLKPHDQRVEPRCPVFMDCGGCQYQHMNIELQRHWKTRHVQEALDEYHVKATASPCFGTSEVYGYRSKLTPHYQAPTSRRGGRVVDVEEQGEQQLAIQHIGFQRQTSRQIVDVGRCAIATEPINVEYERIREELLSRDHGTVVHKKNKGATLLLRQANADDTNVVTQHSQTLRTSVLGRNFTYLAGNFFQNNYFVLPRMVQHVVDAAAAKLPLNGLNPKRLVDCYCGSGLFAISAASRFESILGIEINDRAVQEATANAAQNHLDNCRFVSATAERIFQYLEEDEETMMARDRAVVVLDPPRKGCSESFLEQLLQFAPARIVYLSCDPVTQARDLSFLLPQNGGSYEIDLVQPFDLFPQTRHIECLVVLNRQTTTGTCTSLSCK